MKEFTKEFNCPPLPVPPNAVEDGGEEDAAAEEGDSKPAAKPEEPAKKEDASAKPPPPSVKAVMAYVKRIMDAVKAEAGAVNPVPSTLLQLHETTGAEESTGSGSADVAPGICKAGGMWGSVCSVKCKKTFKLTNGNLDRTCLRTGEWDGQAPKCETALFMGGKAGVAAKAAVQEERGELNSEQCGTINEFADMQDSKKNHPNTEDSKKLIKIEKEDKEKKTAELAKSGMSAEEAEKKEAAGAEAMALAVKDNKEACVADKAAKVEEQKIHSLLTKYKGTRLHLQMATSKTDWTKRKAQFKKENAKKMAELMAGGIVEPEMKTHVHGPGTVPAN